jgi:hypothetical protein
MEEIRFLLIFDENKLLVCPFDLTKLSQPNATVITNEDNDSDAFKSFCRK